jgi:hypothetical protein
LNLASWQAFYASDWQFPWAVMVGPLAFAVYRAFAGEPRERGVDARLTAFASAWTTAFTAAILVDPLATGPLAQALDRATASAWPSSVLSLAFVLLGDFRVYWLVLRVAAPELSAGRSALQAALLSALAPVLAGAVQALARGIAHEVPSQVLWISHELAALAILFLLSRLALPSPLTHPQSARFLRELLGFAAATYALWIAADALILGGIDAGWLVRCVPNQLYYGGLVPFAWWRFFARRD